MTWIGNRPCTTLRQAQHYEDLWRLAQVASPAWSAQILTILGQTGWQPERPDEQEGYPASARAFRCARQRYAAGLPAANLALAFAGHLLHGDQPRWLLHRGRRFQFDHPPVGHLSGPLASAAHHRPHSAGPRPGFLPGWRIPGGRQRRSCPARLSPFRRQAGQIFGRPRRPGALPGFRTRWPHPFLRQLRWHAARLALSAGPRAQTH